MAEPNRNIEVGSGTDVPETRPLPSAVKLPILFRPAVGETISKPEFPPLSIFERAKLNPPEVGDR